ncbi:hypothetical protein JCM10213_005947 [Rhodosporidiobolus nylandii]
MPSTVLSESTYVAEGSTSGGNGAQANGKEHLAPPVLNKGKSSANRQLNHKPSFLANSLSLETLSRSNTPFFHTISESTGGLIGAIKRLDEELVQAGRGHLLSRKSGGTVFGRIIEPGCMGLYSKGAEPRVILDSGRYPGSMMANWVGRSWYEPSPVVPLSSPVINFGGFTAVQVAGNQAAIVCDPSNRAFLVKNGGFCALSLNGHYRVLGVVDQVNLEKKVIDPQAAKEQRLLGRYQQITMNAADGTSYVAATFLDVPANNVVILQRGDELEQLPAGQHCILNSNVSIRGWYTTAEMQLEMKTPDIVGVLSAPCLHKLTLLSLQYTRDQVPVALTLFIRFTAFDPLKLCREGYDTPYSALRDKTLSCLTQVVSHLQYADLIKQRGFGADDSTNDPSSGAGGAFLDALRARAMDDLHVIAHEYGINLSDLAVIDRQFKGETARTLDSLTVRALQAQAANIDRENSNKVKAQEGALSVAEVAAKQRKTDADAQAYATIAAARAAAEAIEIAARARANAVRIEAEADANVRDEQARRMQMARIDVNRISAYGNKTVFVDSALSNGVGANVMGGYAMAVGGQQAR